MNKTKDVSNWYHCQSLRSVTVTLADKCNAGVTTVAQSSFAIHWVCLEHKQNQGCYQLVPLSVISSKHNIYVYEILNLNIHKEKASDIVERQMISKQIR